MPPSPRVRPYKDFLTPAMHRRFAMGTGALVGLCYIEAVLIGEWNSFIWSWFPFGMAGIRTGLLFIPAFMIFILRVAQLHVGLRTSYSAFQTFTRYSTQFQTIQTFAWYLLSGYLFSEIYIWSASKSADLSRIKYIARTERLTLNERPIYVTSYLIFLALVQAGYHLFYDYDRVDLPTTKTGRKSTSDQKEELIISPTLLLRQKMPALMLAALKRSVVLSVVSPFIYSLDFHIVPFFYSFNIRRFAWTLTRSWAKVFWTLPKSGALPMTRPFHWTILITTVTSGFLVIMLWEFGNAAFSMYAAQEPLKNERPITYESRDPNGSLLTGLKGKKLQTRAFAFWELVYIAERFQGRRKVIFEDIDRTGGSTWSQILAVCLETITGIDSRIAQYQAPPATAAVAASTKQDPIQSLPRLAQPLKDGLSSPGDLFSSPPPPKSRGAAVIEAVGTFAKSHGQSPPTVSPNARKLLEKAESAVLSPKQQETVSSHGLSGLFKDWAISFLQSIIGRPFRQEYRRRITAVVLGSPYGDVGIIVDAVDSLTRFAVCSLKEDKYGNVQRDLKRIIQTLTTTVTKLEAFKKSLGFHWTDVEKKQESPEVDMILVALKGGLNELVTAFGDYSEDLRLSQSEMRMARDAVASPIPERREMERIGG